MDLEGRLASQSSQLHNSNTTRRLVCTHRDAAGERKTENVVLRAEQMRTTQRLEYRNQPQLCHNRSHLPLLR
ncbi:hypothetical protein AOLI_G00048740 [Acnodon oligacanthus]